MLHQSQSTQESLQNNIPIHWTGITFFKKQVQWIGTDGSSYCSQPSSKGSDILSGLLSGGGARSKEIFSSHNSRYSKILRMTNGFIITGSTKELLQYCVKLCIEKFLNTRGLSLSEDKTIITHIDKGFDFLRLNVRKSKGKNYLI